MTAKITGFRKTLPDGATKAGHIPVGVDIIGQDADGNDVYGEASAGVGGGSSITPGTVIHADWADVPGGALNPAVILTSEVIAQAGKPASGRYAITVVNTTDVAVDVALFNYEDVGIFWDDTEPHEVMAGLLHLAVGGSLEAPHIDICPVSFLVCEGLESILNPGSGIQQGRVEIRLQGATNSGGVIGFVIRAV